MTYISDGLYTLQTVTSTPTPLTVVNRAAYVCKGASFLIFQLPASTLAGFKFRVIGNLCNWKILQNANQFIQNGTKVTNTGVTGSLASTDPSDVVEILCTTLNNEWKVLTSSGNLETI